MNKIFLLLLSLFSITAFAQEDSKYLAGTVPVVNDQVVFSKDINVPTRSQQQVYNALYTWVNSRFKESEENWGKILYANQEKGQIICYGNELITFTRKALVLDQAKIFYRITLTATPGVCNIKIHNIFYLYENKPEKLFAEEWITDKYALNKSKTKLTYGYGKFRAKTIDLVESLFEEIQLAIGATGTINQAPASQNTPPSVAEIPAVAGATLQGYKRISPDQIPGNIVKMLTNDWMLITAGKDDKFNMMTASWGGLGHLYGKPVALCFISPARHTYELMEKNDTYTLSFYTETYREALKYCGSHSGKDTDKVKASQLTPITTPSGSKSFSEAWMIIECRKLVSQAITPEAIANETLKKEWEGKPLHKMYIGEILNVWTK